MKEYEFHPFANAFPMMTDREHAELVADIKRHGVIDSLTRYQGKILDGRNRYKVCFELNRDHDSIIEPSYVDFDGDDDAALAFVISKNLVRRHLDESQRAMAAAKLSGLKSGQRADRVQAVPIGAAAAKLNVGRRSVTRARKVIDKGSPELVAAVERGDIAVSAAATQIDAAPICTAAIATNGHADPKAAAKPSKHKLTAKAEADIQRREQIAVHVSLCLESLWVLKNDLAEAHAGFKNDKAYRLWLNSCRLTGDAETILNNLLALDGPCQ